MFKFIYYAQLSALIPLLLLSNARAEEDVLINQSATASLSYVKTQYKMTTARVDQKIDADTVKGRFTYSRLLTPKYVLFSALQIYKVTIADSINGSEKNEMMGGLEMGARYFINSMFSATGSVEFQRQVYFQLNNNNTLSGGGHWNPTLSAAGYYQVISREHYSIIPSLKGSLIIGSGDHKMGSAYLLNANYNYYLPSVRLTAGLGYESRTQKYKDLKLTESGPQITFGAGMSF